MIEEMYKNNGVGLAANQIGSNKIFVIDISNERNNPQVFVNPIIKKQSKEKLTEEEGCLSCPGQLSNVRRHIYVAFNGFVNMEKNTIKLFIISLLVLFNTKWII